MRSTDPRLPTGEATDGPAPRRAHRLRHALAGVGIALLAVVLVVTALALWSVRRPHPQTSGALAVAVLDGPVEVHRDELGVPTIVATSERDLFRAQGFVHAQDRFWQMDSWRHIARGRTAELFGDAQLDTDRFLRTLGWERIAEAEHALLEADTRRMLDDYADGVNAYLESRPARALGLEYAVLGLTSPGYSPRPWEPVDSVAFLKLMAWDLRGNIDAEIERAVLLDELGPELLADLYPPYDEAPVIVDEWGRAGDLHGTDGTAVRKALEEVADALASVPSLSPPGADGVGSNSWVVAGGHTASGGPVLANDPHLGIQMPSIWYQNALRCDADCDLEATGFSFPSLPGVVIGHNGRVAWGVTNLGQDVMDLYVERVDPDGHDRYEVEGEWVDMERSTETLRSADGTVAELEVRRTRNGPVISGVYDPVEAVDPALARARADGDTDGADDGTSYAIALRWTALEPRPMLDALPGILRAADATEFTAALASWHVPGQNFVYADVDGTIGYQATGVVPVRAGGDGRLPVPGWVDDYRWVGEVPYEELPAERDPDRGWIVTANNPVVGAAFPHLLGTDWDHGQRAARISELLEGAARPLTLDDVQRQQIDNRQHAADWLVPALAEAVDGAGAVDERARLAADLLEDWDGHMDADSAGAAVFAATWRHLLAHLLHGRLPERYHPAGGSRWFEVVRRLLDAPDAQWWDDPATGRTETRDDALVAAAAAGVTELEQRFGDDPHAWEWGALHTATFRNQTLGDSGIGVVEDRFNRGPYPVGGSTSIVNAVGWNAAVGYEVVSLPSLRLIVDLGDLDRSRGVHTTGQSGHAYHRDYTSMVEPWRAGEQHRMRWDLRAAAEAAVATLRLEP